MEQQSKKRKTKEELHQEYLKGKAEHERRLATDPEYKAQVEEMRKAFDKILILNDCED